MKNNYRLPSDYHSRIDYQKYIDGHDSLDSTIYQPLVYKSAFEIVKQTNASYLIDIGCGDGTKVAQVRGYKNDCKVIMIDHEFIINNVVKKYDFAQYMVADFDLEIPSINDEILQQSVIICSDVIEHLLRPEILIEFFRRCKHLVKAIVISTPERIEERGCFDYGPPANPYHVREWSLDEFTRLLMDYGFTNRMLAGLTISNNYNNVKATLLCIISKFIEYKPSKLVDVNYVACDKNVFLSNIASVFSSDIKKINDDVWYFIDVIESECVPLTLYVPIQEQISLAHENGCNVVYRTELEANFDKKTNIKAGDISLLVHEIDAPLAAIKGDLLKKIILKQLYNVNPFPFNVLSICQKAERGFFSFFKNEKNISKISLSKWHENITRKQYIVELTFGGKVK